MTSAVNHADRAHAVLSASSASRWLNCTPSARLAEDTDISTSVHAEEGTLAHEISENELRYRLGLIDKQTYSTENLRLKAHKLFDVSMLDPIEDYVNFCLEQVAEARANSADALVLIEERLSLEDYIEEGFGTGDLVIVSAGVLYVTDLKFGQGVRVSAVNNDQLKIYGLGALSRYEMLYDIHTVRLTVMQPRLDAVSTWDISTDDLLQWAEDFVRPQAKTAYEGKGTHVPGDWCRFCPAKLLCPALKEEALRLADEDFASDLIEQGDDNIGSLHYDSVLEIYHIAERVKGYLNAVEAHVLESALNGKQWPGLKLVEGRGRRSIQDTQKAMRLLAEKGVPDILYKNTTVKLHGLTNLRKALGKENMDKWLGPLIEYSPGKPTLVDESDKRPALSTAEDFNDGYNDKD